jgi:hypothetical protein
MGLCDPGERLAFNTLLSNAQSMSTIVCDAPSTSALTACTLRLFRLVPAWWPVFVDRAASSKRQILLRNRHLLPLACYSLPRRICCAYIFPDLPCFAIFTEVSATLQEYSNFLCSRNFPFLPDLLLFSSSRLSSHHIAPPCPTALQTKVLRTRQIPAILPPLKNGVMVVKPKTSRFVNSRQMAAKIVTTASSCYPETCKRLICEQH